MWESSEHEVCKTTVLIRRPRSRQSFKLLQRSLTDSTLVDRFSATGYFVLEHLEHITDTTRTPEELRTHRSAVIVRVSLYMLDV